MYNKQGYGDAGASGTKRALKGFLAHSTSAQNDIDENNQTLRQRARMLYMAAPIATSAIRTNRTNVIGCGLKLKARISREALGLTQKQADLWEKRTEAEFSLWASKKYGCDATGVNDFYAMQQLCFISWLLSGDSFVLIKQQEASNLFPYSLRLHIIEADRVSTPSKLGGMFSYTTKGKTENKNIIFDGVELDKNGAVVAYHISKKYPTELDNDTWTRVEAIGEKTGMPNILHIMDSERPEQYRGVSYLAQVIEPLLQLRRYAESEITAALIESFFTAFIKTEGDPNGIPMNETEDSISRDDREYELGPGTVNVLKPGESVEFGNPTRPSTGFEVFTRALCEQVGAALEIPADLLLKSFNASYSASRAALLEAWKAFKMRREWFTNDFCKPVYELWLTEAVSRGRIQAVGFFNDPYIKAAWLGSEWIGPSQGQLDPVREITAEILAISEGITTREQSTVKLNGGSWDSNMEQIAVENQAIAAATASSNMVAISNSLLNAVQSALTESFKEDNEHEKRKNG